MLAGTAPLSRWGWLIRPDQDRRDGRMRGQRVADELQRLHPSIGFLLQATGQLDQIPWILAQIALADA